MKKKKKEESKVFVKVFLPESVHRKVKAAAAIDGVKVGDKVAEFCEKGVK